MGPASWTDEMIPKMITAGVNIFRLNCSHRRGGDFERVYPLIRSTAAAMGVEVCRSVCNTVQSGQVTGWHGVARGLMFRSARAFCYVLFTNFPTHPLTPQPPVPPAHTHQHCTITHARTQVEVLGDLQGPKFRVGELADGPIVIGKTHGIQTVSFVRVRVAQGSARELYLG